MVPELTQASHGICIGCILLLLLYALAQTCQKYWVGKPKYWGGQKVVKSDKLLGARARAAPESLRLLIYGCVGIKVAGRCADMGSQWTLDGYQMQKMVMWACWKGKSAKKKNYDREPVFYLE